LIAGLREQFQVSERRACQVLGQRRSVYRYQPQPNRDGEIIKVLLELAHARPNKALASCFRDWERSVIAGITNASIACIAA
jgi:nitroreductase